MQEDDRSRLLDRLEEAAARSAERDVDPRAAPDLVGGLIGDGNGGPAPDLTFAGYVETHDRVPAFEGSDGQPYTVDIDAEQTNDPARPWAAFLVFVRWAATGAGIMGHLTSPDLAWGETEEAARLAALDMTLFELKTELDRAIARRVELLED